MPENHEAWLAAVREEILDPDRPIVDAHHHLFTETALGPDYLVPDFAADTGSGHRIVQSVYVECGVGYRPDGPDELRSLGETEWVDAIAQQTAADGSLGATRIEAIVGTVDLDLGARAGEILAQHLAASTRLRGIRNVVAWDDDPAVPSVARATGPDHYRGSAFREGFALLAPLGLSFDAWHYHPQTRYLVELAQAFPETSIVMDHFGTPIRDGAYGDDDAVFAQWAAGVNDLAACENVTMKLGGMLMPWNKYGWESRERPGTSDEMVAAHGRYYHHAIEAFGPERCMFESNFPMDRGSVSYHVVWNAFKKIAAGYSPSEQAALFGATARRVYRLPPIE